MPTDVCTAVRLRSKASAAIVSTLPHAEAFDLPALILRTCKMKSLGCKVRLGLQKPITYLN